MNNCNRCYYYDAKENMCTHGSPIFIDDVCTDYQDSEFVMQIRAEVIDECIVAFNELAIKWFNQGCIALGDIPRVVEELKEQK